MRLLYKSINCISHRLQNTRKKLDFEQIVKGAKREEFYVRKHAEEIGDAIVRDVRERKWMEVKHLLRNIQINELDSWRVFRKIAKTINESCNGIDMKSMSENEVEDMLDSLQLLKFEPVASSSNEQLKQLEFDDSAEFIQKMKQYINLMERQKNYNFMIDLARKVLHTMPNAFFSHRSLLQNHILHNVEKLLSKRLLLNELFTKGCISSFWTKQFIKSIQQIKVKDKPIDSQLFKSFHFQDLAVPTRIQNSQQLTSLRTEGQIQNILTGYGYSLKVNPKINGYQVDFLIGQKIVLQYNGHHHYIINSNKSISNSKDHWKNRILTNRGFFVCSIHYDEWKWLKTFEQRRSFLLQKVEKSWLQHYSSTCKTR